LLLSLFENIIKGAAINPVDSISLSLMKVIKALIQGSLTMQMS
jgi:hypothetical protein